MNKPKIQKFKTWLTKNYDAIYLDKDLKIKIDRAKSVQHKPD